MTETFFYELPEENWKNSEVMQAFVDIYKEPAEPVKQAAIEEPEFDLVEVDLSDDFDYEAFDATQEALAQVQQTIDQLTKMASEAGLAGDGMASYRIERAIEEVKKVGLDIWSPENAE